MTSSDADRSENWRMAFLGPLSADFLRITSPRDLQEASDRQAALALHEQQLQQQQQPQPQLAGPTFMSAPPNVLGRLSITLAQAKLVRNYGLTRMDPYVRLRIGHFVYETQTDPNGGKNPRWNRVVHCQLPAGVQTIYAEIYDECSFKMDELIAWAEIRLPEAVLRGETHEQWHPLSGKQGDGAEGMLDLVLSFVPGYSAGLAYGGYAPAAVAPPVVLVPSVSGARAVPMFVQPVGQPQPQQTVAGDAAPRASAEAPVSAPVVQRDVEADQKQIQEMFPNIDVEVIRSVYDANRGNKDATINSLLQITND